jgi:hypothetical protein
MAGQNHHFNVYAPEKVGYAIDRYINETNRWYGVLNRQLLRSPFVGGQDYSIADIAIYPWIVPWKTQRQRIEEFPALERWFKSMGQRPATVRVYEKEQSYKDSRAVSEAGKKIFIRSNFCGRSDSTISLEGHAVSRTASPRLSSAAHTLRGRLPTSLRRPESCTIARSFLDLPLSRVHRRLRSSNPGWPRCPCPR